MAEYVGIVRANLKSIESLGDAALVESVRTHFREDIEWFGNIELDSNNDLNPSKVPLLNDALARSLTSQRLLTEYLAFVGLHPGKTDKNTTLLRLLGTFQTAFKRTGDSGYLSGKLDYDLVWKRKYVEVLQGQLSQSITDTRSLGEMMPYIDLAKFLSGKELNGELLETATLVVAVWFQMHYLSAHATMSASVDAARMEATNQLFARMARDVQAPATRIQLRRGLEKFFVDNFDLFFRSQQQIIYASRQQQGEAAFKSEVQALLDKLDSAARRTLAQLDNPAGAQ